MPPLARKVVGEEYSFEKDLVAKWISNNPELMCYFIDFLARNNYIAFDTDSRKWSGKNVQ